MNLPRNIRPEIDADALECHRITAASSSSYALAIRLLPGGRRRDVEALYAFARTADDLVDEPHHDPIGELGRFEHAFSRATTQHVTTGRPAIDAIARTIDRHGLSLEPFERFFRSMRSDLDHRSYATWEELSVYMDGSAGAIGELMMVLLGADDARAIGPARDLGMSFQLTNFLRDIGADLDRGREYLPQDRLDHFGVDLSARQVTDGFRCLMDEEIARSRRWSSSAQSGFDYLPPRSAAAVSAALDIYDGVLDAIVAADYDVFTNRARVPGVRKASSACCSVGRIMWSRRPVPGSRYRAS